MVRGVKSLSKTKKTSIYYQGLIKMLVLHEIGKQRIRWKILITQHLHTENKPIEEAQLALEKDKEPQKKKGKKDKVTPSLSRTMSQNDKASKQEGPSSTVNKIFKSQEPKGKIKLVEETSTIALEEKAHKTKTMRKEKNSSENKSEQPIEQSPVTIPQTKKKKRKPVSTPNPVPPCKRTIRSMAKKGKVVVSPHTHEDPIDLTSPSKDLSV
jgi:hypothetical protein